MTKIVKQNPLIKNGLFVFFMGELNVMHTFQSDSRKSLIFAKDFVSEKERHLLLRYSGIYFARAVF